MQPSTFRTVGYAIGCVALLGVIYLGTYCMLLKRQPVWQRSGRMGWKESVESRYVVGNDSLQPFFRLAHDLDRTMRPEFWDFGGDDLGVAIEKK